MLQMIRRRWRADRVPLLLYVITFVVMTYPLVLQMHDHLPMDNVDTHHALWQNWWVLEALSNGWDFNDAHLLFHPNGLNYTLLPPRWSGWVIWAPLYFLFGDPLAYNLTAAIGILLKAYGMYLVGLLLFGQRIPAWVCGAFFAFTGFNLTHALQQPLTGATEWIPWFMLAFMYGLAGTRKRKNPRSVMLVMVLAGFLFSLNVYANLKIGIFAMLLGGGFVVLYMLAHRLWVSRWFWTALLVFGLAAIVFSLPVLLPVLGAGELLQSSAADQVIRGHEGGVDLLTFVKADHSRPLNYMASIASLGNDQLQTVLVSRGLSQIGVVSIAFALMGVVYAFRVQRTVVIWVILAFVFWLLSLGVEIHFNGSLIDMYWTPYRLLEDNFIFQIIKYPFRLMIVFTFCYAILIGYGLHYRLRSLELDRTQWVMLVISVVMLLYGTSNFPIPSRPAPRPDYLGALADLPEGAVIDVPLGRHTSKYYMAVQRFHGRPIVEGMIARVPPGTYDYINANLLLADLKKHGENDNWFSKHNSRGEEWEVALAQLVEDGFRWLILHREVPQASTYFIEPPDWIFELFTLEIPVYEDSEALIYDITNEVKLFHPADDLPPLPAYVGDVIHVGDTFHLYSWLLLDSVDVQPCQTLAIESWWQKVQRDNASYILTPILARDNRQAAITNKTPADVHTRRWKIDRYYRDQAELTVPCDVETGKYDLLLGMKDNRTGEPLEFRYSSGDSIGHLYYMTTLNVEAD